MVKKDIMAIHLILLNSAVERGSPQCLPWKKELSPTCKLNVPGLVFHCFVLGRFLLPPSWIQIIQRPKTKFSGDVFISLNIDPRHANSGFHISPNQHVKFHENEKVQKYLECWSICAKVTFVYRIAYLASQLGWLLPCCFSAICFRNVFEETFYILNFKVFLENCLMFACMLPATSPVTFANTLSLLGSWHNAPPHLSMKPTCFESTDHAECEFECHWP